MFIWTRSMRASKTALLAAGLMAAKVMLMECGQPSCIDRNGQCLGKFWEVLKGRVVSGYGSPVTTQRSWNSFYQDSHFQFFLTEFSTENAEFSSHIFIRKSPCIRKIKMELLWLIKTEFSLFPDALSPINLTLAPQQNNWGFMKRGSKTSVLQIRLWPRAGA